MAQAYVARDQELAAHALAYHRFMLGVKWLAIHLASLIAFLTLWFATPAGFWAGLIAGVAVFLAGIWAMRHGLAHSTESEPEELAFAIAPSRKPDAS